jgi:curved DNA-binding protein CbpA
MSDFDPYLLLGVGRNALPAAIKTAYRGKVQTAHPDRGGDPAVFIALVRAFAVLSDPDARRLFDETGIVDDEGMKTYRREVGIILADMFDAAVETAVATGLKLERVNFIAQMSAAVQTGLGDAKLGLKRADSEIGALQGLRRRIRRNDTEHNIFSARLDAQIKAKTEQHTQIKRRVAMLETALVELGNYENEVELIAALDVEA